MMDIFVLMVGVASAQQICTSNYDCPDLAQQGCCGGICTNYSNFTATCQVTVKNRPMGAMCTENLDCSSACCGNTGSRSDECVAPLLDCKNQIPITAFILIVIILIAVLSLIFIAPARKEEKAKRQKIERLKRELREKESALAAESQGNLMFTTSDDDQRFNLEIRKSAQFGGAGPNIRSSLNRTDASDISEYETPLIQLGKS